MITLDHQTSRLLESTIDPRQNADWEDALEITESELVSLWEMTTNKLDQTWGKVRVA